MLLKNTLVKQKVDTPKNWRTNNPILPEGVLGFESTTQYFKIGDGVTDWNSLPYASAKSESQYKNIVPYINLQDDYVTYEEAVGAYYTSGDFTNLHFTITATIDKTNLDPNTPIAIVLAGAPQFRNESLINADLGSILVLGFGDINDVCVRGNLNTSVISLKVKSTSASMNNSEFMSNLTIGDITDSKGKFTVNGVISYFGTDVLSTSGLVVNVPDGVTLASSSTLGYEVSDHITYCQFYAILSCTDYTTLSDNETEIKITLPEELPAVRSITNSYISGTVHVIGLDTVDCKLSAVDNSRELTLISKSYDGVESMVTTKYKDITQNAVIISGTFIYFGA